MAASKTVRKWTDKEMAAHGFSVGYYGGWYVELNAPKGLNKEDHFAYLEQKSDYINRIGNKLSKSALKNRKGKHGNG